MGHTEKNTHFEKKHHFLYLKMLLKFCGVNQFDDLMKKY